MTNETFKRAKGGVKKSFEMFNKYLDILELDEQTKDVLIGYAEVFYIGGRADFLADMSEEKQNGNLYI